jgi:hypothetical protein
MKKLLSFISALLFAGSAGIALCQNDSTPPAASAAPAAQTAPMAKGNGDHPLIHEIRTRLEDQNKRIMAGVKNGKLTKDEATALHGKVKSIRVEMQVDLKSNGKKELTEDQYKQLNQELDDNSKAIHDEKSEGAANTGASTAPADNAVPAASTTPAAN